MRNNSHLQSAVASSSVELTISTGNVQSAIFPLDRIKESQLFNTDQVHVKQYATTPQFTIAIMDMLTDSQANDVLNAIDMVLKFHNK